MEGNMTTKIKNVIFHAVKTFNNASRQVSINEINEAKFDKLVSLVDELRFTDLSIPYRLLNDGTSRSRDPVAHLSYYDSENVVVGVFILRQGAKIPLHDHPGMHGLLRVLHGTLEITSYNISEPQLPSCKTLKAVKNPSAILSEKDGCSKLTPLNNNIHEVVCVSGPAAFLDILSPAYSEDNSDLDEGTCHYFREAGRTDDGSVYLKQIPCPGNYWHDQDTFN